jgi:uncharacterized protein YjbI with pentapeptide repeats
MTKNWTVLITASLATLLAHFAPAPVARADIFEWEYINPANPSQGKQPSTMLAPDGAGANAVPGANLSYRNLTMAYLIGADLSAYEEGCGEYGCDNIYRSNLTGANLSQADLANANFTLATLTNANLSQANLTNAGFRYATLTSANLTGAEVRGANFDRAFLDYPIYEYLGGITVAQLYSTASYQAHDLSGIQLERNNLAGVNLAGQNLTNANFSGYGTDLTGANLSHATLSNALLRWATLTDADLSQANLTDANFYSATLIGANLTGAEVRGAYFGGNVTATQLYSTASYQAHDLTGIGLFANLASVNLSDQNLTNAAFGGMFTNANFSRANLTNAYFGTPWLLAHAGVDLTGANLSQANLTNANFAGEDGCGEVACATSPGANLTNANLGGADARGANFYSATLTGANTSNLIQSDGHIAGLDLTAGASLVVRDYDGNPAVGLLPIVVEQHLAMDTTGALRLVFDADPWNSTISFAPGIPVARGGTLELAFAPEVNLASQSGRTIDLFDWTGVTPSGAFTVSSPYTWNLANLYTTGEVTLSPLPAGDYSGNGIVGPEDYNLWKANYGSTENLAADGNGDGRVNAADYTVWRNHLGETLGSGSSTSYAAVPEPKTLMLFLIAAVGAAFIRKRCSSIGSV